MKTKWHKHLGIYGIVIENDQLLVIKKTKGPYIGRFDLPGGGVREDESLFEHLKREFIEETGYEIDIIECIGVQDYKVEENYQNYDIIHHIALFYSVRLNKKVGNIDEFLTVNGKYETNDSLGIEWKSLENFTKKNSSPLILSGISFLKSTSDNKLNVKDIITFEK